MATKTEKGVKFDAASYYSDTMDVISKRQNFESSSLDVAPPMSTGLCQIDMLYGGGIRASMITAAADEQAAKTTLALATMASAIKEDIPIIGFMDYEGCFTGDTLIDHGKGQQSRLDKLFDLSKADSWEPGTWPGQTRTDIGTVELGHAWGGTGRRQGSLYYKGKLPTSVITLDSGHTLEGHGHLFFVLNSDHTVIVKSQEELLPGDTVLVKNSGTAAPEQLTFTEYEGFTPAKVVSVVPTGRTEHVYDISLEGVGADLLPHSIITNGIVTHNSTKNSKPYVQNILKTMGVGLTVDQVFGKKDATGQWVVKPRVRYRAETILEHFYDWLSEILRELPDKKYVEGKWWLVFDAKNKAHKAKVGEFVNEAMTRKYGNGLWVEAPDDKIQGIIFVDSYTAMQPKIKDDEDIGNQLSVKASAFSKQLERVKGRMVEKMVTVYGLNHLRDNPMAMFGPKQSEKGGKALQQFSDVRLRQTSRSLSAAPFSPKADKNEDYNESEPSTEFPGNNDIYRYVHVKAIKNKLWTPQRSCFIRLWVRDGNGQARGIDPVFDTIAYLRDTGQILGTRKSFKLNLNKLGPAAKPMTWAQIKQWVLGDNATKAKASQYAGYKPMNLRAFCFKQIKDGTAEDLYIKVKNSKSTVDSGDE